METVLTPWLQNLQRLGIKGTIRMIDSSQYFNRLNDFDFDMVTVTNTSSTASAPATSSAEFWGEGAAGRQAGSRNLSGVKDPAVDRSLIAEQILRRLRPGESGDRNARPRPGVACGTTFRTLHVLAAKAGRFAYWSKLKHPPIISP